MHTLDHQVSADITIENFGSYASLLYLLLLLRSQMSNYLTDKEFFDFTSLVMNFKGSIFYKTSRILSKVCCSRSGFLFGLILLNTEVKETQ